MKTNAPIEEAYNRYKKAIDQIARESQTSCEEARRSYVTAVKDACESGAAEQLVETAYQNYMKALLETWGAEETLQNTEQAHLGYLQAIQEASQSDGGRGLIEQRQRSYEHALYSALAPEIAPKCTGAYNEYINALNQLTTETQAAVANQAASSLEL